MWQRLLSARGPTASTGPGRTGAGGPAGRSRRTRAEAQRRTEHSAGILGSGGGERGANRREGGRANGSTVAGKGAARKGNDQWPPCRLSELTRLRQGPPFWSSTTSSSASRLRTEFLPHSTTSRSASRRANLSA